MIVHLFNSSLVSGPEVLVLRNLASLSEHQVRILFLIEERLGSSTQKTPEFARQLGLETSEILVRSRWDQAAIQALAESLATLHPTIVHAHDIKASFYLLKANRLLKAKNQTPSFHMISTHHGIRGRAGFKNIAYEKFYSYRILPDFHRVLTVCTSDREILLRRGLEPSRVVTHLNGVTRIQAPIQEPARSLLIQEIHSAWKAQNPHVQLSKFTIGIVGRYSAEKRHAELLHVLALFKQKHPELQWQLLCFGSGALETELKALTQELDLSNEVHWMGYRANIGNELAGFDLLVSLSFAEGLPINLVEAGWAGTPVLATWVDGNRDLFPSQAYGVLISPKASREETQEAIFQIYSSPSKRRQMGEIFQKRVSEHFSGKIWLQQLLKNYEETAS